MEIGETGIQPNNQNLKKVLNEHVSVETLQRICRALGGVQTIINPVIARRDLSMKADVDYQSNTVWLARIIIFIIYISPRSRPGNEKHNKHKTNRRKSIQGFTRLLRSLKTRERKTHTKSSKWKIMVEPNRKRKTGRQYPRRSKSSKLRPPGKLYKKVLGTNMDKIGTAPNVTRLKPATFTKYFGAHFNAVLHPDLSNVNKVRISGCQWSSS